MLTARKRITEGRRGRSVVVGLAGVVVGLGLGSGVTVADPSVSPELVPFTGTRTITATWGAPSGGYHAAGDAAIDVAMPIGTPIYAAGAGTVTRATVDNRVCNPALNPGGLSAGVAACLAAGYGGGTQVRIQHPDGRTSVYLHLSGLSVIRDQQVSAGQQIGVSGNTGITTGAHLHYGEIAGGANVDPGVWVACHGATRVEYGGLQTRVNQNIRNDGYSCGGGPGVGSPTPPVVGVVTDQSVGLAWAQVPGAASYQVSRDGVIVATTTGTSFTDMSVAPDSDYNYQVGAYPGGQFSAASPVATHPRGQGGAAWADFNGDGRADYCRRVGGAYPASQVRCLLSSGSGFSGELSSGTIDWGYPTGRAWVDANGDGRADYCRVVGENNGVASRVSCTYSNGSGFGSTMNSGVIDWGHITGRAWQDANGDGRADYCRRVGQGNGVASRVACTYSTGTGFGTTVNSEIIDWGYGAGRSWVDVNADGRADYCRAVGNSNGVDSRVSCLLGTTAGFGAQITSGPMDWGYPAGRGWVDFNGDGRADYCRAVGNSSGVDSRVACTVSTGTGFGATFASEVIDWGYDTGRGWVDANGDGRADYCRVVGNSDGVDSRVQCTYSTGSGFSGTGTSSVIDWGYGEGRSWRDADGDGRADYCRRVGNSNGVDSRVQCTLATADGFGATIASTIVDWGYQDSGWGSDAPVRLPAAGGTPNPPAPGGSGGITPPLPGSMGTPPTAGGGGLSGGGGTLVVRPSDPVRSGALTLNRLLTNRRRIEVQLTTGRPGLLIIRLVRRGTVQTIQVTRTRVRTARRVTISWSLPRNYRRGRFVAQVFFKPDGAPGREIRKAVVLR